MTFNPDTSYRYNNVNACKIHTLSFSAISRFPARFALSRERYACMNGIKAALCVETATSFRRVVKHGPCNWELPDCRVSFHLFVHFGENGNNLLGETKPMLVLANLSIILTVAPRRNVGNFVFIFSHHL